MKKTIIITGADGGMGTEISREAARKGYHENHSSFKKQEIQIWKSSLLNFPP